MLRRALCFLSCESKFIPVESLNGALDRNLPSCQGKDVGARRKKGDKFKEIKEAEMSLKASASGAAAKAAELASGSTLKPQP